jgi:acetyltransferase-like isoleucine patch superfamily enzyme
MAPHSVRRFLGRVEGRYRRWLDPSQEDLWRSGVASMDRGSYQRPHIYYNEGDTARVRIGRYCSIAAEVAIMPGGNHLTSWVSMYPFRIRCGLDGAGRDGHPASKGDVVIGSDVWIGSGALILSGVTVGDGAVIAARSVVTKPVPPYAIAAGNPARVVAQRFSEEEREQLLRIRWWDWPEEVVLAHVDELNGSDIKVFLNRFGLDNHQEAAGSESRS